MDKLKESSDVDLAQYARTIAKRKKLIFVITLICLAIARIVTFQMTPVYEATAELLVYQSEPAAADRPLAESYQAVLISERLTNTYSQMLKERTVAEKVVNKLDLDTNPIDLAKRIDARPIQDTQLIQVSVVDSDPRRASRIANTLSEVLGQTVKEISASPVVFTAEIKLVEPAVSPVEAVAPKPALYAIVAMLFGLTSSIGLAFLLDRFDTTIKSRKSAEALSGLPSLGSIPSTSGISFVTASSPQSRVSDAYRHLRTTIQRIAFESTPLIVVTSSGPRDGKTSLAINLGAVLAQAGHRVLVVDCDLRKPSIHGILELGNDVGVASVIAGDIDIAQAIQLSPVERLSILTAGPRQVNPADLFSSERMDIFLRGVQGIFDYVILDCPPILAVPDAVILATKTDGALISAAFGKTNKDELVQSRIELERVGARILGFVLSGEAQQGHAYDIYYRSEPGERGTRKTGLKRILATTLLIISIGSLVVLAVILSLSIASAGW